MLIGSHLSTETVDPQGACVNSVLPAPLGRCEPKNQWGHWEVPAPPSPRWQTSPDSRGTSSDRLSLFLPPHPAPGRVPSGVHKWAVGRSRGTLGLALLSTSGMLRHRDRGFSRGCPRTTGAPFTDLNQRPAVPRPAVPPAFASNTQRRSASGRHLDQRAPMGWPLSSSALTRPRTRSCPQLLRRCWHLWHIWIQVSLSPLDADAPGPWVLREEA